MGFIEEETVTFIKYLKKLKSIIELKPKFSLIENKIYDKKEIDDILCCIEASWPKDYKKYVMKFRTKKLNSTNYYNQIILAIKNKFLFSSNVYSVDYKKALNNITSLISSIEKDMRYINSDQSGMY